MICCPKCDCELVRVHAQLCTISMVRRGAAWNRHDVPRATVAGLEVSCAECLATFTVIDGKTTLAPIQKAYDALRAVTQGIASGVTKEPEGKGPSAEKAGSKVKPQARPAPDPRARQRRDNAPEARQ